MSFFEPSLSQDQKNEITAYVNSYRAKNQAPPMVWDDSIYTFSQNWASYLMTNNLFQHSGNDSFGENLAYFQGYGTDPVVLLKRALDSWYSEISQYDFNSPGYNNSTGHFTCLVWKSSTNFALGVGIETTSQSVTVTMNTSPPGNVLGDFVDNVLPVLPEPVPVPFPVPLPVTEPEPVPVPVPEPLPVPNPRPEPMPLPPPEPVPNPTPSPVPSNMKINVQSAIYNIVYMFEHNQNRYSIIYAIRNIIALYSDYMSENTINQLENLIFLLSRRTTRMAFIYAVNSVLATL